MRRLASICSAVVCCVAVMAISAISASADITTNYYVTVGNYEGYAKDIATYRLKYNSDSIQGFYYEDGVSKGTTYDLYDDIEHIYSSSGECYSNAILEHERGSDFVSVYGRRVGNSRLGIVYDNGEVEVIHVNTMPSPAYLSVDKNGITMGVGETCTFNAYTNSGSWCRNFTWLYSPSNMSVNPIDNMLTVTATQVGNVDVSARTYNNLTATSNVTIKNAPTFLKLNKTSITMGVGETFDLNSSIDAGAGAYYRPYYSSNTNVASVTKSGGIITAKNPGTAVISVSTYNGKTATCVVTVKNAPSKVSLNKSKITLGIGETFDLNSSLPSGTASYKIAYSSNNTNVVSVKSSGGIMTANNVGTATITATTFNGKKATCVVTVKNAPTSISLNATNLTLRVGQTFDLNSSLPSGCGAYSIKYTTNDKNVADVKSSGGLVTAKSKGVAVVKATTYNGKMVRCRVIVE